MITLIKFIIILLEIRFSSRYFEENLLSLKTKLKRSANNVDEIKIIIYLIRISFGLIRR